MITSYYILLGTRYASILVLSAESLVVQVNIDFLQYLEVRNQAFCFLA
jgi:hypothetical protein